VKIDNFFAELKRRNVYKVAVAYAVVGWLLVQVATQVFPFFEIPNWAVRLVVLAIVIGFPVALAVAWAFELTPQGLKRTEDVDLVAQGQRKSHAWIYVVIVGAAFSIGLIFIGRYTASRTAEDGRPSGPSLSVTTCHGSIPSLSAARLDDVARPGGPAFPWPQYGVHHIRIPADGSARCCASPEERSPLESYPFIVREHDSGISPTDERLAYKQPRVERRRRTQQDPAAARRP